MSVQLTEKQTEATGLLASHAEHIMLFGGSRSGKTFTLCRATGVRAIKAPGSRHLIARFRFNHIKTSVVRDTWPKMMRLCFPSIASRCKLNMSEGFVQLPRAKMPDGSYGEPSEVWFGGLDDEERVEKILGNEYATIYPNECSQITSQAREMLLTRLAQTVYYPDLELWKAHEEEALDTHPDDRFRPGRPWMRQLPLKAYYDCNPPGQAHWTYRLFVLKRTTEPPYKPLPNPDAYAAIQMNPRDNAVNLTPQYLQTLQNLSERARLRFWEGNFGGAAENALWTHEQIGTYRVNSHPDLQRVVVAIDPSGASGKENERSDHIGIVVVGLGIDGDIYVLEDLTVKGPPSVWGKVAVRAYQRHGADAIIGEENFGGAMVEFVVQTAARDLSCEVNYKTVRASRGKVVRAEPISALYAQGRVHHVGTFPELEDQLCAFTSAGYTGDRSPDRADADIWGVTELVPGVMFDPSAVADVNAPFIPQNSGRGSWMGG